MVHLEGRRTRLSAILAISLLVVTVAEAGHSHDDDEGEVHAACFLCAASPAQAAASGASASLPALPALTRPPARPATEPIRGGVHRSPHHSRAPPGSISP